MQKTDSLEPKTGGGPSFPSSPVRLHSYAPLIKTAQTITLFLEEGELFAKQFFQNKELRLPIYADYPLMKWKLVSLVKFLNQTSAFIECREGIPHRVCISLCLPGGMIGQGDILPATHSGYAIGNVIHKDDLLLPKWERLRAEIEEKLAFKEREYAIEKRSCKETVEQPMKQKRAIKQQGNLTNQPKVIEPKERPVKLIKSPKINELLAYINKLTIELETVSNKIVNALSTNRLEYLDKTLPMDVKRSKLRLESNASFSEKMDYFTIDAKEKNASNAISALVSKVFSQDGSFTYLPPGTVETVTKEIEEMLLSESRISVIGSFITLPGSKIMDPIVIRDNAEIDAVWKQEPENYYVLTEAVLGGLFLGYGKEMSGSEEMITQEQNSLSQMSQITALSFVAQGAIPVMGVASGVKNLWSIYLSWRDNLLKDQDSGYPIGYKYRSLNDILVENRVI